MVFELVPYLFVFSISVLMISYGTKCRKNANNGIIMLLLCALPVVLLYGLREGIGTDYYAYEEIYRSLHNSSFTEYLSLHAAGTRLYYVEIGFYLLNKIAFSYRCLLFIEIFIILVPLLYVSYKLKSKINVGFAIYIYLCIYFIYSMNGVRFAIALSFVFVGIYCLLEEKYIKFFLWILIAYLFHTSMLVCFLFIFLKDFNNRQITRVRDVILFIFVCVFPIISNYLMSLISKITVFQRYFLTSLYTENTSTGLSFIWIIHIVPVLLPILLLYWKEIKEDCNTRILLRIAILEIPFRILGLSNTFLTRLTRIPQLSLIILIPYVINQYAQKNKTFLYIYYILWYTFYFGYYAIVNDAGDSLPYISMFNM